MRERPILFSAPMVRAILEGRKTQTRRVCKGQRELSSIHDFRLDSCPYGQPGDRLWVRESFWVEHDRDNFENCRSFDCGINLKDGDWARVCYCASQDEPGEWFGPDEIFPERTFMRWGEGVGLVPEFFSKRPSIHMPRWASRITLEVTGVRVERLQDISDEDAAAEGIDYQPNGGELYRPWRGHERWWERPQPAFRDLWDHINGPKSWRENPWVWVVEFKRVTP